MHLPLNTHPRSRDIAFIGVMVATIEAAKLCLSMLAGIELVSLLIIMYTLYFRKQIPYVLITFILLEGLLYGFGIWWIMYVYLWPLLALVTWSLRRMDSAIGWAMVSGSFGLIFGGLCSLPYIVTSGPAAAFAYWIAGIPYDVVHGIGNLLLMLLLYRPLKNILQRLSRLEY